MTDFETWLLDCGYDRIFEMDVQSNIGVFCRFFKIKEAIELPDGDILIGFYFIRQDESNTIHYKRLSEINFSYNQEYERKLLSSEGE